MTAASLCPATLRAETGTTTLIHQFSPPAPHGGFILGADGNFYGTTGGGGIHGYGTVIKMTGAGAISTLHSFSGTDGYNPQAELIQGTDGTLYGTTLLGGTYGYGTVFKITTAGVYTLLHSFDDPTLKSSGAHPKGKLAIGNDGNLYGSASDGGDNSNGILFKVTPAGAYSVLHTFDYYDGEYPAGGLCKGTDGALYGTAYFGGNDGGSGAVFRVTTGGAFSVLHSFKNGSNEGSGPIGTLVQGKDGNFYGVTEAGGDNGWGTIFKVTSGGGFTQLHSLTYTEGSSPEAGLIKGGDGNFYGTTTAGGTATGSGTVFRVTPGGTVTTLHSFDYNTGSYEPVTPLCQGADGLLYGTTYLNLKSIYHGSVFRISTGGAFTFLSNFPGTQGADPMSGLIQAKDGNFYGTTYYGGDSGVGTVFKMTTAGTPTTLHSFNTTDGRQPTAGVVQATDGNFYGVTLYGGTNDTGTFFKITSSGTHTLLYSFTPAVGYDPNVPVIQAKDGFFYGLTSSSGPNYNGGIYKLSATGAFTTVHNFVTGEGYNPGGPLLQAADGNFYGVLVYGGSNGVGSVFKVTSAGAFTTLHSFSGGDGRYPYGQLVQGADGNFYGTTSSGGPNSGYGTVFRISSTGGLATLHTFNYDDGYQANGLVNGGDGYFYGTTGDGGDDSYGGLFRINAGGAFTLLHSFDYTNCGTPPYPPIKAADGAFYGTLSAGGWGDGGVYRFSLVPVLTSATTASGTVGKAFSYQTTGSNNPTSFAAAGLPSGLSIDQKTGKITGTPTVAGTFTVKLTLGNASGTSTAAVTITIKGAPPVITSSLNPPSRVNVAFTYQITATNSPTSYAATGLPPGLSINTTTGKISGTPTKPGTYSVAIKATNASGTGSATLSLVVKAAPPVITSSTNPPSRQGVAFTYQITATNSPTSYGASGLPAGLAANMTTGQIKGTPTKAGTYQVTVKATNSGGTGTKTVTIVVKPAA